MTRDKLIPKRRFKEFENDGAWVQRKLGEVAEFNPKSELPETFEYVDLESVLGTELITHRQENKSTAPSRAQRLAQKGDLFYQTVRPYQKNNYLFEKDCNNFVFSTGYAQLRPNGDGYFLLCYVQNNWFVKLVLDRCTGTSYPAINSNDLADIDIFIPINNAEQEQIGIFFNHLDNLIAFHQHKLIKLKETKTAYLSEMFPKEGEKYPKRRFAGFTEPWVQHKLGEVVTIKSGSSPSNFSKGNMLYIKVDDLNYSIREQHESNMKVKVNEKANMVEKGSVIFPKRGAAIMTNKVRIIAKAGYMDTNMMALEPKNINGDFLYMFIYKTSLYKIADTSTIPQINNKHIEPYEILLPKSEEQKKIGAFFHNLDNLITLHQRKLEKLENIKKAYLNEMFV